MGMMINRRRVCGGKKGLLPSGYVQLEYIENQDNAYIDTGFVANQDSRVSVAFKYSNTSAGAPFVYGAETPRFSFLFETSNKWRADYNQTMIGIRSVTANDYHIADSSKNKFYLDGMFKTKFTYSTFSTNKSIFLFACHNSSGNLSNCFKTLAIYKANCYDNDILVRNFIPCKNPNNVVGMYDTVNGVFYSSPNGTAFVAGPEV